MVPSYLEVSQKWYPGCQIWEFVELSKWVVSSFGGTLFREIGRSCITTFGRGSEMVGTWVVDTLSYKTGHLDIWRYSKSLKVVDFEWNLGILRASEICGIWDVHYWFFGEPGQFLRVEILIFVKIAILAILGRPLVLWSLGHFCEKWSSVGGLGFWEVFTDLRRFLENPRSRIFTICAFVLLMILSEIWDFGEICEVDEVLSHWFT